MSDDVDHLGEAHQRGVGGVVRPQQAQPVQEPGGGGDQQVAGVIPVQYTFTALYCTVLLSLYSCSHSPGVRVRWPAARTASSASSVAGHSRGCLAPLTLPVVAVSPAHLSPIPARVRVTCHVSHCPALLYLGTAS